MLDDALKVCPRNACARQKWGRGRVKKIIGAGAGVIFKGSGFYITDYRSDKYHEAAKKESGGKDSGTGSGGSGPAKSDAKPSTAAASPASKSEPKGASAGKPT